MYILKHSDQTEVYKRLMIINAFPYHVGHLLIMERPAERINQSAKIFAEFLFPWKFVHTKWSWCANCVKSVTYIRKEYKYQAVQNLPVLCYLVQHNFHTDNNTDKKKIKNEKYLHPLEICFPWWEQL